MRAVIQRVTHGSVKVNDIIVGKIGAGLVVLLGIKKGDTKEDAQHLSDKIVHLRIFTDKDGKFNLSALDTEADIMVVSQFTLIADTKKGHRPSFIDAAPANEARELYNYFLNLLNNSGLKIEKGIFQESMIVEINNDGPVTIILESPEHK